MAARSAKPLSYDRIVQTALAVIDKEGAEGFTLERVATKLGVRAPSLYNHVGSKAVIIEGVRDLVVSEMDYSAFGREEWDVALEAWARSYHQAFAAHPNTVTLLYTTPVDADATYVMYEAVTAGLAEAGWPVEMTVPITSVIEYLIAGSVLDRAATGTMFGQARERGAPTVAVSVHAAGDQVQLADDIFEFGLAIVLDDLRRRYRALGLRPAGARGRSTRAESSTATEPPPRRRRAV